MGKAIPGVEIEIDTRVTDDRVDGEIVIYGPNVMQRYHNRPEENAEVLLPDGGFRSGDMGRLDDEGYLYITGRIKEQYKLENGKYVVPTPLEEKLKLSPYIANVLIYGENRPFNVALVVLEPNAVEAWAREVAVSVSDLANNEQVRKLVSKELGRYSASFKGFEQPKKFAITLEDFTTENGLLTPTLKLKRRNVQAQYRDQLDTLYLDS